MESCRHLNRTIRRFVPEMDTAADLQIAFEIIEASENDILISNDGSTAQTLKVMGFHATMKKTGKSLYLAIRCMPGDRTEEVVGTLGGVFQELRDVAVAIGKLAREDVELPISEMSLLLVLGRLIASETQMQMLSIGKARLSSRKTELQILFTTTSIMPKH